MSGSEQQPGLENTEGGGTDTGNSASAPPLLPHLQQQQQQLQQHESAEINYEQEAQKLEDKALRFLAKQAHPVIIPSFAAWFKFSEVHEIEKRSIPDFFDESSRFKTPKAYKDARNFMINTYRLSPYEYLTMTAVRRNIAMDVASIVKIHAFLEKWGLINYQIDPRSKPTLIGPSFTGHFQVILDTPQGLKPFVPPKLATEENGETVKPEAIEGFTEQQTVKREKFPINLSLKTSVYDTTQDFNALQSRDKSSRQIHKTYICHTCGNDAIVVRYHNLRARDANLCSRCFQEGHFGANFQASDFVRLKNDASTGKRNWSDQEILLLLEGIEMYEDQWEKIVDHLGGTKTLEECVEKFLCLPIEDNYIDDIIGSNKKSNPSLTTNDSANTNIKSFDSVKAVDVTIRALLDGLHKQTLEESLPESSRNASQKYLQETQSVIQELVQLTLQKLGIRFKQLNKVETALEQEKRRYVEESEKMLNDRISLSKQVNEVNSELSSLNISKKLVLVSEQVDSGIKLVEEETQEQENKEKLGKKSDEEMEAVSQAEPQMYKPWSL